MSVLALVCDEGGATNERLRYVLNMHKAEISDLLKLMVQKGLLETYGHGRGMHYISYHQRARMYLGQIMRTIHALLRAQRKWWLVMVQVIVQV